jgi:hypothetical protein
VCNAAAFRSRHGLQQGFVRVVAVPLLGGVSSRDADNFRLSTSRFWLSFEP